MNDTLLTAMNEATRLTRSGQLSDATALIQTALQGKPASGPTPDADRRSFDGDAPALPPLSDLASGPSDPGEIPMSTGGSVGRHLRDVVNRLRQSGIRKRSHGGPPTVRHTPPETPEGAQFLWHSFTNQAGTRAYKTYVPSGYRGEPLPLVVMLHGCTQDPDDFAAGTRMNALAEEQPCLVVYPAQPPSANSSKCWNWFAARDQVRHQGEPSIIAGITRQVMSTYAVDPTRVYVAGMSAGGAMAAIMAVTYPDLYAAVGVHSGLPYKAASDLPSAFAAMRGTRRNGATPSSRPERVVPTIVFHGDADATVHPHNGDQVIAQWQQGLTAGPQTPLRTTSERGRAPGGRGYTRTMSIDEDGASVLEQWLVHGAGHAWSGGSAAGSYTDPQGPEATREMLRFFAQHRRP